MVRIGSGRAQGVLTPVEGLSAHQALASVSSSEPQTEQSTVQVTDTLPSCFGLLVYFALPFHFTFLLSLVSHRSVFIFDLGHFSYNNKSHTPVSVAVPIHIAYFVMPGPLSCSREVGSQRLVCIHEIMRTVDTGHYRAAS